MNSGPSIAVVTAVYQHAHFIARCIESVQAQTYPDYRHIIVDDGSTDGLAKVVLPYARRDPRIVFCQLPTNRGHAGALNAGIGAVRADWYLKADGDDTMDPTYLERIMEVAATGTADVIFSPALVIAEDGTTKAFRYPDYDPARIAERLHIPGPAAFTRILWSRIDGFDSRLRMLEDWDFWVRAERTRRLRVVQLSEPLWHYRQHSGPRISTLAMSRRDTVRRHLQGLLRYRPPLKWRALPPPDLALTESAWDTI